MSANHSVPSEYMTPDPSKALDLKNRDDSDPYSTPTKTKLPRDFKQESGQKTCPHSLQVSDDKQNNENV